MTVRPIVVSSGENGASLKVPTIRVVLSADLDTVRLVATDLADTLFAHPIAVGMSANQIGLGISMAVVCLSRDPADLVTVINPEGVTMTGKKDLKYESCMSLPGRRGPVERRYKVQLDYLDVNLVPRTGSFSGFEARVWLHELDHLNGLLYESHVRGPLMASDAFDYEPPIEVPYSDGDIERLTTELTND
jgi:peptide deformylase